MKKLLCASLTALLIAGSLSTAASAHKDFQSWGDVPMTSDKIVIDGKLDDVYKKGLAVDVSIVREDGKPETATATGYYIHDGEKIYCCVVVNDSDLTPNDTSKQSGNFWECDGAEICFDFGNDGKTLTKWTVWYEGWSQPSSTTTVDAEIATTYTTNSYIVELATALPDGVKAGSQIGVNILIDNMTSAGRVIVRAPQSGNATENELAKYDYIVLSDKTVTAVEPVTGNEVESSAKTLDPTVLVCLTALTSGAALTIVKKKSK